LKGDEIVILEDLNFLAGLTDTNILRRQGMNGQSLCNNTDIFTRGISNVDPPHRVRGIWTGFLGCLEDAILVSFGEEICPG
jgi:hypothetical protein